MEGSSQYLLSGGCMCAGCHLERILPYSDTHSSPQCWHKRAGNHHCWTCIHLYLKERERDQLRTCPIWKSPLQINTETAICVSCSIYSTDTRSLTSRYPPRQLRQPGLARCSVSLAQVYFCPPLFPFAVWPVSHRAPRKFWPTKQEGRAASGKTEAGYLH